MRTFTSPGRASFLWRWLAAGLVASRAEAQTPAPTATPAATTTSSSAEVSTTTTSTQLLAPRLVTEGATSTILNPSPTLPPPHDPPTYSDLAPPVPASDYSLEGTSPALVFQYRTERDAHSGFTLKGGTLRGGRLAIRVKTGNGIVPRAIHIAFHLKVVKSDVTVRLVGPDGRPLRIEARGPRYEVDKDALNAFAGALIGVFNAIGPEAVAADLGPVDVQITPVVGEPFEAVEVSAANPLRVVLTQVIEVDAKVNK